MFIEAKSDERNQGIRCMHFRDNLDLKLHD